MEPGCYFIDALLVPAMENESTSKFFNHEVIGRFKDFGGVRIESDVVLLYALLTFAPNWKKISCFCIILAYLLF